MRYLSFILRAVIRYETDRTQRTEHLKNVTQNHYVIFLHISYWTLDFNIVPCIMSIIGLHYWTYYSTCLNRSFINDELGDENSDPYWLDPCHHSLASLNWRWRKQPPNMRATGKYVERGSHGQLRSNDLPALRSR